MKNIFLTALAALALTTACKKDNGSTTPAAMQVTASLSPANEVPAITTVPYATGSMTGTYDPTTKMLMYTLTFSGLSSNATAAHLHYGDAKHKGNVWLPFANVPVATSGTISGMTTLTQMQADSLTMGHVYANIHTTNNGGGEIRATVVAK